MGVVSISDGDDLAGDALTDLVLDPGGLSADALSLSPENLGVLPLFYFSQRFARADKWDVRSRRFFSALTREPSRLLYWV